MGGKPPTSTTIGNGCPSFPLPSAERVGNQLSVEVTTHSPSPMTCHPENPRVGGPIHDEIVKWGKRVEGSAFRNVAVAHPTRWVPRPSLLGRERMNRPRSNLRSCPAILSPDPSTHTPPAAEAPHARAPETQTGAPSHRNQLVCYKTPESREKWWRPLPPPASYSADECG